MVKSAKMLKRDNTTTLDIRGCPMYKCSECGKRFQTARIGKTHAGRKHG